MRAFLNKKVTLVLIFTSVVSGLLLVEPCMAPITVPDKPSAGPKDISVEIHNTPIWYPPYTITNPYTGEVIREEPGYYRQNGTIVLKIKNQPFTPYTDEKGNTIHIYYCIFFKYENSPYGGGWLNVGGSKIPRPVYQSDSDYTVTTYTYGENSQLGFYSGDFSFRVQTVEGYFTYTGTSYSSVYEGVGSAWSEFTINIPANDKPGTSKPNIRPTSIVPSTSPDTSPTSDSNKPPPQNMQQLYLTIIVFFVCIVAVLLVVIVYLFKQRQTSLNQAFSRVLCT